jgi:rhomboid family GlyGly-CTERM serine protease
LPALYEAPAAVLQHSMPSTRPLFRIGAGERAALAGALALLLLQALVQRWPPIGAALEYRRALVMDQPWRLVTGHLIHVGWLHALVNLAAWWLIARLIAGDLDPLEQLLVLVAAAIAISLALAAWYPQVTWYRGLSGALHALFVAGAVAALVCAAAKGVRSLNVASDATLRDLTPKLALPLALVAGAWLKVAFEVRGGAPLEVAWLGAPVVTQAHLVGAAFGTLAGIALGVDHLRRGQVLQCRI